MLRALSSSLYKYTTFSREIQIELTFRNTLRNVKMQRFAAAVGGHVLYYEACSENWHSYARREGEAQLVEYAHGFRDGAKIIFRCLKKWVLGYCDADVLRWFRFCLQIFAFDGWGRGAVCRSWLM